jgi:hypothetical protein
VPVGVDALVRQPPDSAVRLELGLDVARSGEAVTQVLVEPVWVALAPSVEHPRQADVHYESSRAAREAEDHSPAGYPDELAQDAAALVRPDVLEHVERDRDVEAAVGKAQRAGITLSAGDRGIDGRDVPAREPVRDAFAAAANLQHGRVRCLVEQP